MLIGHLVVSFQENLHLLIRRRERDSVTLRDAVREVSKEMEDSMFESRVDSSEEMSKLCWVHWMTKVCSRG